MTSLEEQASLEEYNQIQELLQCLDARYIEHCNAEATTSTVEQAIMEEGNQLQEHIQDLDATSTDYYSAPTITSFEEQVFLEEFNHIQELLQSLDAGCIECCTASTICPVEQPILEEHDLIQEQLQGMDTMYNQHYAQEDIQHGEQPQENNINEDGEPEGEEQTGKKKKAKSKFLAQLQKSWGWIASLTRRGNYTIKEDCSSEIPGPSHMVDTRGNRSSSKDVENGVKGSSEDMTTKSRSVQNICTDLRPLVLMPPEELHRSSGTAVSLRGHNIFSHCSSPDLQPSEELPSTERSSHSSMSQDKKATTAKSSVEKDGTSAGTSVASVPLSLLSFTFHRVLGKGGFGHVLLATDIIRKEHVAIKAVNKRYYKEERNCCFAERQVLQISHQCPYLIHGLAGFHTKNYVYYVMELAARGDLHHFLEENSPLDIETSTFITAELVCGIQFLHNQGILHRDLKPLNILLTTDGHIKIADFGLAVTGAFNGTALPCRGTPGYAAPEIVHGLLHTSAADYFSIGVILYKLMTAKTPFPGSNGREREMSVLNHTPVFPESLTPDAVSILEGLLCKNQFLRLGFRDIRTHPFFSKINWEDVEARRMEPPAILRTGAADLHLEDTIYYAEPPQPIQPKNRKLFKEFSFVCPAWSKNYHPVRRTRNWLARLFTRFSCIK
ncbi:uncharacterized protein [Engystomops pustulosus]|uniref:uncharacterized protein n=1 Tax=Engystomops pustulosus TaxID=76066 RepID=UPI003AFACF83